MTELRKGSVPTLYFTYPLHLNLSSETIHLKCISAGPPPVSLPVTHHWFLNHLPHYQTPPSSLTNVTGFLSMMRLHHRPATALCLSVEWQRRVPHLRNSALLSGLWLTGESLQEGKGLLMHPHASAHRHIFVLVLEHIVGRQTLVESQCTGFHYGFWCLCVGEVKK